MFWNKTKTLVHLFKNFENSFREEFRNHFSIFNTFGETNRNICCVWFVHQ